MESKHSLKQRMRDLDRAHRMIQEVDSEGKVLHIKRSN